MRQRERSDGLRFGEGTIVQRGDSFQARWRETTHKGNVRRARSFPTRDAAEDHLRQMFRTKRDGGYVPPSELTVKELVEGYLFRGTARWRPYTLGIYRHRASRHIYPTMGHLRAETLTTPQIQHWIDRMSKDGLGPSIITNIATILGGAFNEARKIGLAPRNPVTDARLPKLTTKEPTVWSHDEINTVMATIDRPMYYALYRIAMTTGMRPGELLSLRWSDVDFAGAVVHVRRTLTRDADLKYIVGDTTKGSRSRPISIAAPEVAVLRTWKKQQAEERLACAKPWDDGNWVFTVANGRHLTDTTWHDWHRRLCLRAGVTYITPHGLRHINATIELAAGTSPKIVMERLGHRSIKTTLERYSHVSPSVHQNAANDLSRRLFGDASTGDDVNEAQSTAPAR